MAKVYNDSIEICQIFWDYANDDISTDFLPSQKSKSHYQIDYGAKASRRFCECETSTISIYLSMYVCICMYVYVWTVQQNPVSQRKFRKRARVSTKNVFTAPDVSRKSFLFAIWFSVGAIKKKQPKHMSKAPKTKVKLFASQRIRIKNYG